MRRSQVSGQLAKKNQTLSVGDRVLIARVPMGAYDHPDNTPSIPLNVIESNVAFAQWHGIAQPPG